MRIFIWEGLTGGAPGDEAMTTDGEAPEVTAFRARQDAGEIADDIDPAYLLVALMGAVATPVTMPQTIERLSGLSADSAEFRARYAEQLRRIAEHLRQASPPGQRATAGSTTRMNAAPRGLSGAGAARSGRPDVGVQAEEVAGVVAALDRRQSGGGRGRVGRADPVFALVLQEAGVGAVGVRSDRLPEGPRSRRRAAPADLRPPRSCRRRGRTPCRDGRRRWHRAGRAPSRLPARGARRG